jgi:3-oxoadipate enol-lactonase
VYIGGVALATHPSQGPAVPSQTLSPGLTIHYLDENATGTPTVLLLHGLGGTGGSWQRHISWLAQAGYRVLAPDMRGFGQSSYPGRTGIALLAQDMAELLQRVGAGPAHVVGISLGGTVAQQVALDHPALARSLVLVNTFAKLRPDGFRSWLYYLMRLALVHTLGLGVQARLVARYMFPGPKQEQQRRQLYEQVIRANVHAYRATMRALWAFDVESRLGEIHVPTQIITGDQDSTVAPRNQRLMVDRIPGARQVVVANANHAVMVDQPEAFERTLRDFRDGLGSAPATAGSLREVDSPSAP